MTVTLLKTKTCVLNKKFHLENFSVPILFGNKPIEECDEYSYLEFFFQNGVTGSKAIMQQTCKSPQRILCSRKNYG